MRTLVAVVAVALSVGGVATSSEPSHAAATQPFSTALLDPEAFAGAGNDAAMQHAAYAGASSVVLVLDWRSTAPAGSTKPLGFDATDPASSFYDWSSFDQQVRLAAADGLSVIAQILDTPTWALDSPGVGLAKTLPDPAELGNFALAAAERYGGTFGTLPRVRAWDVWNEPNISLFLAPQFVNGVPFAPGWYRQMVNDVAVAVKSVHSDNIVIAGGTAPFFDNTPAVTALDPD